MQIDYIPAKTIVSSYATNSNWFGTNYNMNIYKGCCHGCIYCDSRSECYRIDNFDKVKAKANALEIIRNDLRRKVKTGVVATGSMSDPYNPFEKELLLTRHALELINAFEFGAAIATKSNLITRDIDILSEIKEHSPVLCKITITCADDELSKIIEPNVCVSSKRFEVIRKLSNAGIFTGILLMPVLPFITDTEENIRGIVRKAHESGARFIYSALGMTLRTNQRDYYYQQLDKHFPNLKEKYIKMFENSYSCGSPRARELSIIFRNECNKYGIIYKMSDIIKAYKLGYDDTQLSFFD